MINCKLQHLQARCYERGYTLDEVRACIIREDDETITVDENHPSYPLKPKPGFESSSIQRLNGPSLLQKAKNFVKSTSRHIANGMQQASEEEISRRFTICQGCEFFDGKACKKCGCPIVREQKLISKLSWANEKCPMNKW